MKYVRSIFFSLALFLCFSPISSAGLGITVGSIDQFDYFMLVQEGILDQVVQGELGGVVKASYLAKVNPKTGVVTKVGDTGHGNCTALDFNPAGDLFATCQRLQEPNEPVLVRLDTATGVGTEVGPTGITERLSDITNVGGYTIHTLMKR